MKKYHLCDRKMKSQKWFRRRNKHSLGLKLSKIKPTLISKEIFSIKNIEMPFVKYLFPKLIMQEIASVQPISDDAYNGIYQMCAMSESYKHKFGDLVHSFGIGWIVFDGKEMIPLHQFVRWFGKDKISNSKREIYRKLRDIV
jgi:hypothetical protein